MKPWMLLAAYGVVVIFVLLVALLAGGEKHK